MEYVVIETGGKQYKVSPGTVINVDSLGVKDGEVTFDKVLLHVNGEDIAFGEPYLAGVAVKGKVLEALKGDKVRVARFLAKSRHRKVTGFRASLSRIEIGNIVKTSKNDSSKESQKVTKKATRTQK